jgi:hypothetical protein
MIDELQIIEEKISEIMVELRSVYFVSVDQTKATSIRADIVELLDSVTMYLNKKYTPMTPWQKDHIVEAVNALYWGWLHLALNSIRLAIADSSTISPDNNYKDEIVKLTFDDLAKQISIMKNFLGKK